MLESIVGARNTSFFGTPATTPDDWSSFTNPWGGNFKVEPAQGGNENYTGNWPDENTVDLKATFTYMPFFYSGITRNRADIPGIPLSEAQKLTFDNNPEFGKKMWVKVVASNYAINPADNSVLQAKTSVYQASTDQTANKMLEARKWT